MAAANGENYAKWTMNKLKEELERNGLETGGKKSDLVNRMNDFIDKQIKTNSSDVKEAEKDTKPEAEKEKVKEEPMENGDPQTEKEAPVNGDDTEATEVKDETAADTTTKSPEPAKTPKSESRTDRRSKDMPSKGEMKKELLGSERIRTVIVGPVTIAEANSPELQNFQMLTERFHNRFFTIDGQKRGYSVLRFYSFDEAEKFVQDYSPPREDIKVLQFTAKENGEAQMTKDMNPPRSVIEERDDDEPIENRIMFVGSIPPSHASDESLQQLFPDAQKIHLARNAETREPKGHAYIFYESHDDVIKAVGQYKDKVEIEGTKVVVKKFMNVPSKKIDRSERDTDSYPLSEGRRRKIERDLGELESTMKALADDAEAEKEQTQKKIRLLKRKLHNDTLQKSKLRKAGFVHRERGGNRGPPRSNRGGGGGRGPGYGGGGRGGYRSGGGGGYHPRGGMSPPPPPMMRPHHGGMGPAPSMQSAVTKQALELLSNVSMALGHRGGGGGGGGGYDDGYRGGDSGGYGYDGGLKRPMMSPGEVPMKRMRSNMGSSMSGPMGGGPTMGGNMGGGAMGGGMGPMLGGGMSGPMGGAGGGGAMPMPPVRPNYGGSDGRYNRYSGAPSSGSGYGGGNYGDGDRQRGGGGGGYRDDYERRGSMGGGGGHHGNRGRGGGNRNRGRGGHNSR